MSLSQLVSFKSRFVTYLLNFPRKIIKSHLGRNSCILKNDNKISLIPRTLATGNCLLLISFKEVLLKNLFIGFLVCHKSVLAMSLLI